jgi:hypothetical protein
MHLYLFVRGKFTQVEEWKAHAQTAYWKWRRINNKTGKEEMMLVQGALRPSVLGAYEYVFPKEALAEVCSFFGIRSNESYGFGKIGLETRHLFLRKIFGAKKIPKEILKEAEKIPPTFTTEEFERGCSNCIIPGVALHVIGIKDDDYRYFEESDYTHEAL